MIPHMFNYATEALTSLNIIKFITYVDVEPLYDLLEGNTIGFTIYKEKDTLEYFFQNIKTGIVYKTQFAKNNNTEQLKNLYFVLYRTDEYIEDEKPAMEVFNVLNAAKGCTLIYLLNFIKTETISFFGCFMGGKLALFTDFIVTGSSSFIEDFCIINKLSDPQKRVLTLMYSVHHDLNYGTNETVQDVQNIIQLRDRLLLNYHKVRGWLNIEASLSTILNEQFIAALKNQEYDQRILLQFMNNLIDKYSPSQQQVAVYLYRVFDYFEVEVIKTFIKTHDVYENMYYYEYLQEKARYICHHDKNSRANLFQWVSDYIKKQQEEIDLLEKATQQLNNDLFVDFEEDLLELAQLNNDLIVDFEEDLELAQFHNNDLIVDFEEDLELEQLNNYLELEQLNNDLELVADIKDKLEIANQQISNDLELEQLNNDLVADIKNKLEKATQRISNDLWLEQLNNDLIVEFEEDLEIAQEQLDYHLSVLDSLYSPNEENQIIILANPELATRVILHEMDEVITSCIKVIKEKEALAKLKGGIMTFSTKEKPNITNLNYEFYENMADKKYYPLSLRYSPPKNDYRCLVQKDFIVYTENVLSKEVLVRIQL